jgi:hypothetical protein
MRPTMPRRVGRTGWWAGIAVVWNNCRVSSVVWIELSTPSRVGASAWPSAHSTPSVHTHGAWVSSRCHQSQSCSRRRPHSTSVVTSVDWSTLNFGQRVRSHMCRYSLDSSVRRSLGEAQGQGAAPDSSSSARTHAGMLMTKLSWDCGCLEEPQEWHVAVCVALKQKVASAAMRCGRDGKGTGTGQAGHRARTQARNGAKWRTLRSGRCVIAVSARR